MVVKSPKSRILVTGASGFVGQAFIQLAADRAGTLEIIGTDHTAGAQALKLDITDADAVDRLVAEIRPDGVLHLAAIAAVSEATRRADTAWAVNFQGTMNVARAVARHVPAARFVFVGSADMYGGTFDTVKGPLNETAALEPFSVYAATKAAADLMICQMVHDGFNAVRFRPFNHTGPGQADKFVVPSFAKQIARIERGLDQPVLYVGNLDVWRDFMDVRDVVDAYVRALDPTREFPRGGVFNLASGVARRIGDILGDLLARAKMPIQVMQAPDRVRAHEMLETCGDARRAREALGWAPRIPWDRTLSETLDFARQTLDPNV
jgi:GDP-4-dehydro-6-deoxy-D-mannose reductase